MPAEIAYIWLYIFLSVVALVIFYHIIRGAVRSGTKDIVEELRKQNQDKEPVS